MPEAETNFGDTTSISARSLWVCLHDAYLFGAVSDLTARTITLEFDIAHLRRYFDLADDVRFVVTVNQVASVVAMSHVRWPVPYPLMDGLSYDEQMALRHGFRLKGRYESVVWADVEAAIAEEPFDIKNAEIAPCVQGIALRLEGGRDEHWYAIVFEGPDISVRQTDGRVMTVDELIAMGEAYWEAFGRGERR